MTLRASDISWAFEKRAPRFVESWSKTKRQKTNQPIKYKSGNSLHSFDIKLAVH